VNPLEPFERTERPVGGSVTDDATREHTADPRQGFDLARTRHVQIEHRGRSSSWIRSYGVRFAGDDAERLAHPAFRRIGVSSGIRRGARSCASSARASIRGSSVRFRAARSGIRAARRIDGGYLSRERLAAGGVGRAATSRGPHDTHARTKHNDTGEEQQRFAFGGCWHGAKIT